MSKKHVVIDGAFTIENVGNIQEQMRGVLARNNEDDNIKIDMQGVTEFDGAGLQLLLAFSNVLAKMGGKVLLISAPDNVKTVLTNFGLTEKLGYGDAL